MKYFLEFKEKLEERQKILEQLLEEEEKFNGASSVTAGRLHENILMRAAVSEMLIKHLDEYREYQKTLKK